LLDKHRKRGYNFTIKMLSLDLTGEKRCKKGASLCICGIERVKGGDFVALNKVNIRLVGYPKLYAIELSNLLFDGNLSQTINYCLDFVRENVKGGDRTAYASMFKYTWYEANRRFKKTDKDLAAHRLGDRFEFTAYISNENLKYINEMLKNEHYAMFRKSRNNFVSACIFFVVYYLLKGELNNIKIIKENKNG
jgi:hypothetical protein